MFNVMEMMLMVTNMSDWCLWHKVTPLSVNFLRGSWADTILLRVNHCSMSMSYTCLKYTHTYQSASCGDYTSYM